MSKLTDLLASSNGERAYALVAKPFDPLSATEMPLTISTHGMATLPTDPYPNTYFAARLETLPVFRRSLFSQGRLSGSSDSPETTVGAIAADGALDYLYPFSWEGRVVQLMVGGPDFPLAEYGDVSYYFAQQPTFSDTMMTVPLRDVSVYLDRDVQSARFAGTGNAEGQSELTNKLKPEAWGYCPKVPAVYVGVSTGGKHLFAVGSGPIVGVLRVWDRGALLTAVTGTPAAGQYSVDVDTGTITLGGSFNGPIQADVIGRRHATVTSTSSVTIGPGTKTFSVPAPAAPAVNYEPHLRIGMRVRCLAASNPAGAWMDGVVNIPRPGTTLNISVDTLAGSGTYSSWIICPWGCPGSLMAAAAAQVFGDIAYIDLPSVVALNTIQPATCGYWVPEGMQGKAFLDLLAEGSGCFWYITRSNTFRVGRIAPPDSTYVDTLEPFSIIGIERITIDEPFWQCVLKHARKWSTLSVDQIAGVANPLEFTEEWTSAVNESAGNKANYLSNNTLTIESVFQDSTAAIAEVTRQFSLFGVRRDYFRISTKRGLLSFNLDNTIFVIYPRYGLASGKALRVIDIEEDHNTGLVTVGVWG